MQTAPERQPLTQPWKSTVAGVLTLVIGGIEAIACLVCVIQVTVSRNSPWFVDFFGIMATSFTVVLAVVAVLAILGGISALQRKRWGLALAGAIVSIIGLGWPVGIVGIVATVFTALARDEFK